jgi:hypothetical protein
MKKKPTKTKDGRGGARPGAGAKKKPPTVTLSWRVPASIAEDLRIKINALVIKEKAKVKIDSDQ